MPVSPVRDHVTVLDWHLEIVNRNSVAAMLIHKFSAWHHLKASEMKPESGESQVWKQLLIRRTYDDIRKSLIFIASITTIRKAIALLVDLDIVSVHKRPKEWKEFRFDRANYYLFNPDRVLELYNELSIANRDNYEN